MNAWQSYVMTILLQVTALAACAVLAMSLARRRAAVAHAIGVVALALVLASPLAALVLPKANWLENLAHLNARTPESADVPTVADRGNSPPAAAGQDSASPEIVLESPLAPSTLSADEPPVSPASNEAITPANAIPSVAATPTNYVQIAFACAVAIWAAGAVLLTLRFAWTWRSLRPLASSVRVEPLDPRAADEARRALGLAVLPPIGVSDLAPMPLVLGCWRPLVVLPRKLAQLGPASRVRDVLIHELAHVARRDPAIHVAQHLARVLFWPHPLVHWLNRLIARSREEVCDNFVLRSGNAAEYSQTILELAEQCGGARLALSLLGMFPRGWSLERRIAGILDPTRNKSTRASRRAVAAVALALAATCGLVGGSGIGAGIAGAQAQDPRAAGAAAEAKPLGVTFAGVCRDQEGQPVPAWVRIFRSTFDDQPPKLLGEARAINGEFSVPNIELIDPNRAPDTSSLCLVASAGGYASAARFLRPADAGQPQTLLMSNNPASLRGVVKDSGGRPVAGATVCANGCCVTVPGFMSGVTDGDGRFTIDDLSRWDAKDSGRPDGRGGIMIISSCSAMVTHPAFATTRAMYQKVPQELNITLTPPAIIQGQVIDEVTSQPLAGVFVGAQGIARGDFHQTTTDRTGGFRLLTNADWFNIFAVAEERMPIAAKNVEAVPGKVRDDVRVRMVRGGYVVGTVDDGAPAAVGQLQVAHYGPARPRSGAAVTSATVNPDGTYRLHVAPGRNYVYLMTGGTSGYVDVADGGEATLNLRTGQHQNDDSILEDPDYLLASRLRQQAHDEDQRAALVAAGKPLPPQPVKRQRSADPAGRLLDKLEEQNADPIRFRDPWLRTLKELVELGPSAVPELTAELDATTNNMMLRCCGFALRAIGDKRAVPALVRAIPQTLLPPSSDMGLRADDVKLAEWAGEHDLDGWRRDDHSYSFGRPVNEIFGALNKLTDQTMGESELKHVHLSGMPSQRQLQRELFYREATRWAAWWDEHAAEFVNDPAYQKTNLPPLTVEVVAAPDPKAHYKTIGGSSGAVLRSIRESKGLPFFDFDTGRYGALPEKWAKLADLTPAMDEILDWAAREGFDMMGTEYTGPDGQQVYALRSVAMKTWELDASRWKMDASDITLDELKAEGTPGGDWLLHRDASTKALDPQATASFLYITPQGTPGLLFVGIEVRDDSLQPGGFTSGDNELDPVHFYKGRRYGYKQLEEVK